MAGGQVQDLPVRGDAQKEGGRSRFPGVVGQVLCLPSRRRSSMKAIIYSSLALGAMLLSNGADPITALVPEDITAGGAGASLQSVHGFAG